MSLQVVLELKRPWQFTAIGVSPFFESLGRKGKRRGREEEGKGREGKGREGKGREGKGRVLASLFQPCWCYRNGFPSVFLLVHVRVAEKQKAVEVCAS